MIYKVFGPYPIPRDGMLIARSAADRGGRAAEENRNGSSYWAGARAANRGGVMGS